MTGEDESDVVWLNIGGIANITFISRVEKKLITSDTGPGNTLMDAWMRKYYQEKMDAGGRVASTGIADEMLLEQLSEHTWFTQPLPKTCGPEIFNIEYVETALNNSTCALSHKDIIATLNELTARSLADVIDSLTANSFKLFISGGGTHNKNLIERIKIRLPLAVIQDAFPFEIHPDAKEAVLIALLANDMITGSPKLWEDAGIFPATGFGKISLPH